MNRNYFYLELHKHWLPVPYNHTKRRVRVLLPKDYHESSEHYPVVYLHDGQNVFYSKEAYSGHSWKVIPAIKRNPDLPKMIIVGIDNAGVHRGDEYTPWHIVDNPGAAAMGMSGGLGREYGEFVMDVVKPFIDSHYRTRPEKEYTAMAGSSLGGNITAFMGIKYGDQIGHLGVFSLANWITQPQFDRYISRAELPTDQTIYIQVGTAEGDSTDRQLMNRNMKQAYLDTTLSYARYLIAGGVPVDQIDLRIIAEDRHTESAWANGFPYFLRFISENWD